MLYLFRGRRVLCLCLALKRVYRSRLLLDPRSTANWKPKLGPRRRQAVSNEIFVCATPQPLRSAPLCSARRLSVSVYLWDTTDTDTGGEPPERWRRWRWRGRGGQILSVSWCLLMPGCVRCGGPSCLSFIFCPISLVAGDWPGLASVLAFAGFVFGWDSYLHPETLRPATATTKRGKMGPSQCLKTEIRYRRSVALLRSTSFARFEIIRNKTDKALIRAQRGELS